VFKKILVPLDGSKSAEKALDYVASLSRVPGACVYLTRLVDMFPVAIGSYPDFQARVDRELKRCQEYLNRLAEQRWSEGLRVEAVADIGCAAEEILSIAFDESIDLIVMTSHGRTGASRFFNGSVAERVSRAACCPVMIVGRASMQALLDN
jgi:nucleotide-binding universal stress UspA family protein